MSKPLDYFKYSKKVLHSDRVSLEEIAQKVGTPVYVYSADGFLNPLRALQKGLKNVDHLICFALKSNSNLSILKLLAKAGAGMDLVTGGELFRAKRAGLPGERLVFSGVGKTEREIREAILQKIYSFNVESISELELINSIALKMNVRAKVALRFNPDVDAKTHPYISTGLKKNKFGLEKAEILDIARRSSELPGVCIAGISIHIGSQILSLGPLEDSFIKTRLLATSLDRILPEPLEFLDLGGGLGISYGKEKSPNIENYCALIRKQFGTRAGKSGQKQKYRILLEPGRLLSGNAGVLISQVLHRKTRGKKDFLIIDAGMNDLMRPALYGSQHQIVPLRLPSTKDRGSRLKKTDVVGPVCETSDLFKENLPLPESLKRGDHVVILSAGAYGFTMAGNYNTRARPAEVLIQNSEFLTIRERENYEDLIRGEEI